MAVFQFSFWDDSLDSDLLVLGLDDDAWSQLVPYPMAAYPFRHEYIGQV